ncbi:receptor-type tyrosine-protein phosphatase alpha-like [Dreissena polymorpha]|uniref:receptor-type tyrosine-protein phosphatase alpha-like n=1 Tax=Dreissena polymorpha TaxID=45954 RepID=UPI002264CF1C|nr:receptor-type tyrosine-protein phosphatase alpha-like [Dreissena polymorpha]
MHIDLFPYSYQTICSKECVNACKTNGECSPCKDGFRWKFCNDSCSVGCNSTRCKQYNATCIDGCKVGYYGDHCCQPGRYGWSCERQCLNNCLECTSGDTCQRCKDELFGPKCENACSQNCKTCTRSDICKICKERFYGTNCEYPCPQHCTTCSSSDSCHSCETGFSGQNCQIRCPDNCQTCNNTNTCTTCSEGFSSPNMACTCVNSICGSSVCNTCTNASYYPDGNSCCPCSNTCKYSSCSSSTHCTHGCKIGYYGAGCQLRCTDTDPKCGECNGLNSTDFKCVHCIDGYYPHLHGFCTTCSKNCIETKCINSTGECEYGCLGGFWNYPQLDGPCSPCSKSCILGKCNTSTGHCMQGCENGFWNLTCESKCTNICSICERISGKCLVCSSTGLFGNECSMTCSDKCFNTSCHMNGTCTHGCISDFFGPFCEKACPKNCARKDFDTRCSNETGNCLYGCIGEFTGVDCMEALKQDSSEDTVPTAAIGGGVAAAVTVVVVTAVVVFIYLRRRHRQPKHDGVQATPTNVESTFAPVYASVVRSGHAGSVYENTSSVKIHNAPITVRNPAYCNSSMQQHMPIDWSSKADEDTLEIDEWDKIARQNAIKFEENGGVYYNNDDKMKNLKKTITELIKLVSSNTMDYYEAEFKKLPYGLLKDYKVSQMTVNITKNRYKGIYPYDDHRIKVHGDHTDYINASSIDGYKRRNEYIATLGPMSKQLGDFGAFWKMVWQQNVEKIVMLTNLVEEGKDKCEQYWPDFGDSQTYGGIRVSCQSEDEYAEFTRRSFAILKDRRTRTLTQLHFTSWPDKDIPEDVTSIIEFRQYVMHAQATLGGPIIVHCSAGVGRTGTYIAIDILTKEGEAEGAIDIPGCVLNMRQNRPNMVQTVGQYKYLHHAVVYALTNDVHPVAGTKFQAYMDTMSKDKIFNMFKHVQDMKTYGSLDESEAVEKNAKRADTNRDGADIPEDEYRLRLHLNRRPGSSDYINAVFVNSFKTKNKYVLAQTPLPNTVVDFFTMLVQTECSCIVDFEPSTMRNGNIGEYLPADNQVLKIGVFNLRCSRPEANSYRIKRTMTIEHQANQRNAELSLTHLEFTDWDMEEPVPKSPFDYRRFISEVDAVTASTNSDKPVVLHCWDGASKCGLFCVVANLLQKMTIEHEVSVVNAVRTVKTRRKGAIPNLEQYQFCHDCVLDYVQNVNIYANVAADLSDC